MKEKSKSDWVNVGKLGSAHKLNGAIKLHLEESIAVKKMKTILCGKTFNAALPYEVMSIRPFSTQSLIVELDGVTTREIAQSLTSQIVWLNAKNVTLSEKIISEKNIGYALIDVKHGAMGIAEEVYSTPSQILLAFKFKGKEIMLPCNEMSIVKINHTKKEITINMPEGLLEVYL